MTEVAEYPVTWETLPANYELPDDPVENLEHPALVGGLTEAIDAAGLITKEVREFESHVTLVRG